MVGQRIRKRGTRGGNHEEVPGNNTAHMRKGQKECATDRRAKRDEPGEIKSAGKGGARIRVHNAVHGRHVHQDDRQGEGRAGDMRHEFGV